MDERSYLQCAWNQNVPELMQSYCVFWKNLICGFEILMELFSLFYNTCKVLNLKHVQSIVNIVEKLITQKPYISNNFLKNNPNN